jgi:methionyl-tRNA formyltransferase
VIRFFDVFFAEYPREEVEVCGITVDRVFHEPASKTLRRLRGLYGWSGVVRQGLRVVGARLRGRSIESLAASHSGRLPTYRGMLPTFWQMQLGERVVTITVHRMAERLDAGDVLATHAFPIMASDSLDRVIKGTKCEGARLMIRVLRELREGRIQPTPVDMRRASYFSFPKREDAREFRRRGHRLL